MPQHSCLQCHLQPITSSKKIPRYLAKLARQMADRFIALYEFHGVLVHRVVKSFSPIHGFALINMISTHSSCEREGDGGLLLDSAQAFFNVFFSQSKKSAFLRNLFMSLQLRNIRFRQVYSWQQWTNEQLFFNNKSAFWTSYFFGEIMLESWGCGLYTSLYGISYGPNESR